jgi:hypothetical protein
MQMFSGHLFQLPYQKMQPFLLGKVLDRSLKQLGRIGGFQLENRGLKGNLWQHEIDI